MGGKAQNFPKKGVLTRAWEDAKKLLMGEVFGCLQLRHWILLLLSAVKQLQGMKKS